MTKIPLEFFAIYFAISVVMGSLISIHMHNLNKWETNDKTNILMGSITGIIWPITLFLWLSSMIYIYYNENIKPQL